MGARSFAPLATILGNLRCVGVLPCSSARPAGGVDARAGCACSRYHSSRARWLKKKGTFSRRVVLVAVSGLDETVADRRRLCFSDASSEDGESETGLFREAMSLEETFRSFERVVNLEGCGWDSS